VIRVVFSVCLVVLALTSLVLWLSTPEGIPRALAYGSGFQTWAWHSGIDLGATRSLSVYVEHRSLTVRYRSQEPVSRSAWHGFESRFLVVRCWQAATPGRDGFVGSVGDIQAPLWLPAVLFAIYPIVVFARRPGRRYARCLRNECIWCGYSLRGTVEHRCPECGKGKAEQPVVPPRVLAGRGLRWLVRGAVAGALAPAVAFALELGFPSGAVFAPSGLLARVLCLGMEFGTEWPLGLWAIDAMRFGVFWAVNAGLFGVLFFLVAVIAIVLRQDMRLRRWPA